jgi:membrane protease YdiL (CAAX protease family)
MLITGLAEETIFRGFLVGMLAVLVPGRLRIGRLDLPVAGYLVALMFGLAHYQSFMVDPFYAALAQQIYAFVWGLTYVWLMERSRSLLAPMIAHGMGNFTEVAIVVLWATALA